MVKRKHSHGKLLLIALLVIQLLQLAQLQTLSNSPTACSPATQKKDNGLDAGDCVLPTASCADRHSFSGFYAIGADCQSCAIGSARASSTVACTAACTNAGDKFGGYATIAANPSCSSAEPADCQTGYAKPTTGTTDQCINCDVANNYFRHNARCKLIANICTTAGLTAFDGHACVATVTQCQTGYHAYPSNPNLCIYCAIGFRKDPVTSRCVSECPTENPRFFGYNAAGQVQCQANNGITACTAGYNNNPNDNSRCTLCAVGYINVAGKCEQVTAARCQTITGRANDVFNGQQCLVGTSVACIDGTEKNYGSNLCIYCQLGFRSVNGRCQALSTTAGQCPASGKWDGNSCEASTITTCQEGYTSFNGNCNKCAFGYVFNNGLCQFAQTVCPTITTLVGYDGQKCVAPTNGIVNCLSNSFANYAAPTICLYCRLGFRYDAASRSCISVTCPQNQFWDGNSCQTGNSATQCQASTNTVKVSGGLNCLKCDFGFAPANLGSNAGDQKRSTTCARAATTCVTTTQFDAYDGSNCVAELQNNKCNEPFYPTATNTDALKQICDGCNLGYVKSQGTCRKAQDACLSDSASPAYTGRSNQRSCQPLTALTNSKDCPDNYFAPNSTFPNLCTACDFKFVLFNGDCVNIGTGCTNPTQSYDGKQCIANPTANTLIKCQDGYFSTGLINQNPAYCEFCDVGFTQIKGGCVQHASTCKDGTPYFDGIKCVQTANFKCFNDDTFGYYSEQQTATKCNFCDLGYEKRLNSGVIRCMNATVLCSGNQIFNGKSCGTGSCLTGYTFNTGFPNRCIVCDIGYKRVNGSCQQIKCELDKKKFNGRQCDFQHTECLPGYASSRNNPMRCVFCALGFIKVNGSCVQSITTCTDTTRPKWNGQACVAATANCTNGYIVGSNPNFCNSCAQKYESNEGKCIQSCVTPGPKFLGSRCGLNTQQCSSGFKDNGENKCIPLSAPCPEALIFNGLNRCAKTCATNYKNSGIGTCILRTATCPSGFVEDANKNCIIKTEKDFLLVARTNLCSPLCLECNEKGECTVCRGGYMLNPSTKRCIPCQGCQTCSLTNPAQCTSCFSPSVLTMENKTCIVPECNANCLQCNIAKRCQSCAQGYFLVNGACQKCNVIGCSICQSSETCSKCDVGMLLLNNKCLPCTVGCFSCKQEDLSNCEGCVTGYYASQIDNQPTRCNKCMQNCTSCQSAAKCSVCNNGYILSSNGEKCILRCSQNCATCQENLPDRCLTCFGGVTPTGSASNNTNASTTTQRCVYDVNSCNTTGTCTFCPNGHVLRQGKCLKCEITVNCNACSPDDIKICSGCVAGFYLQTEGQQKVCKKCDTPCSSCTRNKVCLDCTVGFYLVTSERSASGTCRQCDPSCLTCESVRTQCTSCRNNTLLVGGMCVSDNNVNITTKLDIELDQYFTIATEYQQWIVEQSNKGTGVTNITTGNLNIMNLTRGSTNTISILSLENLSRDGIQNIANAISKAISQGATIGNVKVQSGGTVANFARTQPTTTEQSSSNLGLILGLSIPLGLLFIVAVIVIVYKLSQRKNNNNDNTAVKNYSSKNLETGDKYEQKV